MATMRERDRRRRGAACGGLYTRRRGEAGGLESYLQPESRVAVEAVASTRSAGPELGKTQCAYE